MDDKRVDDKQWDELVETMRREHNDPPPTPRERMWEAIEAKRRRKSVLRLIDGSRRWPAMAVAAAAVLVLGIAVGRMSMQQDAERAPGSVAQVEQTEPPAAGSDDATPAPRGTRRAATQYAEMYLDRSEAVLTALRNEGGDPEANRRLAKWAAGMLSEARLLLDSPAGNDPEMRRLLQDLEMLFAQIAILAQTNDERELRSIEKSVKERSVLIRLQNRPSTDWSGGV